MNISRATKQVLAFIKENNAELDSGDPALKLLVFNALKYLNNAENIRSVTAQKDYLNNILIPIEKATKGKYSFVLEHDLSANNDESAPTIQISTTSGNFHSLIIRRQDKPLQEYAANKNIEINGKQFQLAVAKDRVRKVDLQTEFPALHQFKQECATAKTPIIYFLGGTRQFLDSSRTKAEQILEQGKGIENIFGMLEKEFGNNIVIGTGGWAGTREKSFGIPRMGYLRARASGVMTLTTMPHTGTYDRHKNPSYEVFCGNEWGDDSSVLAAACDAAVLFRPFGTWTNIELANLQAQHKLVAVVADPKNSILNAGEKQREINTQYGSYQLFANPNDAARYVIEELQKRGFEKAKPLSLTSKPGSAKAEGILSRNLTRQDIDQLREAYLELVQNLGPLPDGSTERYIHDIQRTTNANSLFLIVENYIEKLHKRGSERS